MDSAEIGRTAEQGIGKDRAALGLHLFSSFQNSSSGYRRFRSQGVAIGISFWPLTLMPRNRAMKALSFGGLMSVSAAGHRADHEEGFRAGKDGVRQNGGGRLQ